MAKTIMAIPKLDVVAICHNKREKDLLSHFCIAVDIAVGVFRDNGDYDGLERRVDKIRGLMDAMRCLGMIDDSGDTFTAAWCGLFSICINMAKDEDGGDMWDAFWDTFYKPIYEADDSAA